MKIRAYRSANDLRGFSLVEIMVAAVVIGIAILAVVTVARKSREIDVTFSHHHAARCFIDSCFEDSVWQHLNYNSIPTSRNDSVLIDSRAGGTPVKGYLTVRSRLDSIVDAGTFYVVFKRCSATVAWQEPEGAQTVTSTKAVPLYYAY